MISRHENPIEARRQAIQAALDAGRSDAELVTRKILAHTVGVWLNIQQGREPLQLDGVVTV